LQARKGQMLIEVTDASGIAIPRFCYHNKLSIAANCRMCLVDVEKAPKPLPACATPVAEGMVVHTRSDRSRTAQKSTMEFLLINHPLDCPVCDQGGECELQDLAVGYGKDVSRYAEAKRIVKDRDIGPLISTDMTRCIHCTRCVRFGQEIDGVMEFGGLGRGEHMEIRTFLDRSVDSELSGNVIDLCPVGALTSKPFRYTARPWELEDCASISPHDCVGANINVQVRRGSVMRVLPRDNEGVNECWLADRDRFSYEALKGIAAPLEEFNAGFEALMDSALQGLKKEPGVLETLRAQHGITLFREEALKYMMALDIPGTASQELIYNIYNEDRLIRNCLTDEGSKEGLIKSLEGIRALVGKDHERARAVEDFEAYLASTRKGVFGGLLKGAKKDVLHSVAPVVEGYFALAIDCRIERFVDLMRRSLADRRPEFSQNTLLEEYNRGRLYRFSTDTRPVVKSLEVAEEGQLFVDMKDFTRKTLKVKEIAMADFMKEYFYKPILKAASRYSSGSGLTENERGIRLTNIPGDAAIFSGGVSNLVSLARDIQRIIRENRKGLEERLPPKKDTEVLEKVHKSFEARREELKRKRLEMTRELAGDSQGSETRLIALGEEENRIESTYREELENAIKGELETGLYVSYGAKAETMVMESTDGFYGPVKVSIGEKINEASRGTYRHPMVRANLEMLLAGERERRKNRETKYPFDIYIHTTYSLRMPPEIENAFERLVATRKLSNAKALAQLISEDYMSDLEKIISGEPFSSLRLVTAITDIYNKGQALSEAALMAYMKETRGVKRFFNRVVPVKELHPSIQEAFFFPADPLELFLGAGVIKGATEAEGFLKSGEVIFRGFETSPPTVIYEMLDPEGDFFISLVRHHLSDWLEEAKEEGEGERI